MPKKLRAPLKYCYDLPHTPSTFQPDSFVLPGFGPKTHIPGVLALIFEFCGLLPWILI